MTKEDFAILTRVLKELGLYRTYCQEIKNKGFNDILCLKKQMLVEHKDEWDLENCIDKSLWWDYTSKGFTFWQTVNECLRWNAKKIRKNEKPFLDIIELLKDSLSKISYD